MVPTFCDCRTSFSIARNATGEALTLKTRSWLGRSAAYTAFLATTNHAFGPPFLKLKSFASGLTSYRDGSMLSNAKHSAKASSIS